MTESYSSADVIKKFYISDDKAKNGSHLPFNFLLIDVIKNTSKAEDFVKSIGGWLDDMPNGKITNWVVSKELITNIRSQSKLLRISTGRLAITINLGWQADSEKIVSTYLTHW